MNSKDTIKALKKLGCSEGSAKQLVNEQLKEVKKKRVNELLSQLILDKEDKEEVKK